VGYRSWRNTLTLTPVFTRWHDPLTGRTGIDSGNIHLFVFLRALHIAACSARGTV
jgi:hypothetical protein